MWVSVRKMFGKTNFWPCSLKLLVDPKKLVKPDKYLSLSLKNAFAKPNDCQKLKIGTFGNHDILKLCNYNINLSFIDLGEACTQKKRAFLNC